MKIPSNGIDLRHTFVSGQCFRWGHYTEDGEFVFGVPDEDGFWEGVIYGIPVRLLQEGKFIHFQTPVNSVFVPQLGRVLEIEEFLGFYLRTDLNLEKVYREIGKDRYVRDAIDRYRGLTILRQEPYETLISYMISPMNSVEKIAAKLNEISLLIGKRVEFMGKVFPVFPSPDDFVKGKETFFSRQLRLRFGLEQKKNILNAVEWVKSGGLDGLYDVSYGVAIKELIGLRGVGRKIADCVALFSLDKTEAVPFDVHIKRITVSLYGEMLGKKPRGVSEYEFFGDFWRNYFGRYAGFAQEYLYFASRDGLFRVKA